MPPEEDSDATFFTLANLMPTLCWMANADGWIFWYNSRWYEYTGTTQRQMEGWGWQSAHDPAVLPEVLRNWQASIEHGQPFEMTFPLRSAAGAFRPFLTRVTPLRGADGRIYRWLGVNTDISGERAGLELREQFMAVLGHDLRNPLHAIQVSLAALRKSPLDERALRLTNTMQNSAARMSSLIEDVMDMARSRMGGGISLHRKDEQPQALEALLREIVTELLAGLPERRVAARYDLRGPVNCDRNRIAQLLSNLLGNALTYGSAEQPVQIDVTGDAGHFELSVANAGDPIPAGDIERLFQPFFRGAVRPSRQGLGLGLYIAHEIATAHDGTLRVTSDAAETRFTFRMAPRP